MELTSPPAQIVADTIVRTVELGVRITDAAVAGETTVLWCDLLTDAPGRCPGCGLAGVYRDSTERRVSDVPVVGYPLELRVRVPRYHCVHAMTGWLAERDQQFRDRVEIVAMDGFGGYKNAATEALPDAVTVMDPFHVVALAGAKLDLCRQRTQQDTTGHRGRSGDPLYGVRRTLRTRLALLTDRQRARLEAVFAADEHAAVTTTWWVYQQLIAAYADADRQRGKTLLTTVIDTLRAGATGRPRGTGDPRSNVASAPRRHPGLLHPPRLQRPHRGHL